MEVSEDGGAGSPRPGFLVPVKVLSRLFRGRLLAMLAEAHAQDRLRFFGDHAALPTNDLQTLPGTAAQDRMGGLHQGAVRGAEQVLRYLSRYTHRVAISNRRLVAADANAIALRWKDYRIDRPGRWKTMTLSPHEFIRRFLIHVLPKGFHRIRHYGSSPTAIGRQRRPLPRAARCCPAALSPRAGRSPDSHPCSLAPVRAAALA